MAALTLYGSAVADGTLTTANDMATTSGGVETSKTTTSTASAGQVYVEILAQGGSNTGVTAIPTTPTGHGWVYKPGAGVFVAANWSALATLSSTAWGGSTHGTVTMRFFKYSGGSYTSIGTIVSTLTGIAKTTYTFAATSMPATSFSSTDLVYVDLWWFDNNTTVNGDNPIVYLSTTTANGVANDLVVTTANFAPSQYKDIVSRFRQKSADQLKDIVTRLRLRSANQLKDVATRLILSAASSRLKDVASRFRQQSANQLKDIVSRLRVMSAAQGKDMAARLRLMSANQGKDMAARFRQRSADQGKDISSRFRLNNFVTKVGTSLYLNGAAIRSGGTNIYWLGLYQDQFVVRFPYTSEIDDALQTALEMGCLFVRSHTLGISVGNSLSIETSLNTFNDANFVAMDYAIKRAGDLGLKLIIPLTDYNNFYEGSEATFTGWRSLSPQNLFYTNATVIADFEAYISHLLNHVNVYNGLAYKNDPAILCWETGNEINDAPSSWTSTIASYIKSIDSNHLLMCGSEMFASGATSANLALSTLDIFTDHFYPPNNSNMAAEVSLAAGSSKAYIVGEYNWTQFNQAAATFGVDTTTAATGGGSNSAVVNVTSATPGVTGNVQLQQGGLTLVNGSTYTAKFWAKADAARNIDIVVQQGGAPFTVYLQQTIAITTTWTLYTASTFVGATDTNAYFTFNCSDSAGHIWFDLCSLGTGGGNILLNPSFESSSTVLTSWSNQVKSGDTLTTFITAVEGNANISGSAFWDLKPHAPTTNFSWSSDPYRLEYPGENADLRGRGQQIRTDAYTLRGVTVPGSLVPAAPILTSVSNAYVVAWQGAVGAYQYDIERSTTSATTGFTVVVSQAITDTQTPWTDPSPPSGTAWYRVKPYSYSGTAGAYSNVLQTGQTYLFDPCAAFEYTFAHSANVGLDTTSPANFGGDVVRFKRTTLSAESVTWKAAHLLSFAMQTYFDPAEGVSAFTVATSPDNITYTTFTPTITNTGGTWTNILYSGNVPAGTTYLRVTWNNLSGSIASPQIASMVLTNTLSPAQDIMTRFILATPVGLTNHYIPRALSALLLQGTMDISTRFRLLSQPQLKDTAARLRLMSANQAKDTATRFRLRSANQLNDITARLRLMSANQLKDMAARLRLMSTNQARDTATRLRLMSANQLRDTAARLRLMSANQLKDVASRFRQMSLLQVRDVASRFRQMSAFQVKDMTTRFRQMSALRMFDVATRLRLMSANQLRDITGRFLLAAASSRVKDVAARLRLRSLDVLRDIPTRLRLMSAPALRDVAARFRQKSANQLRDTATRFRLMSLLQAKDITTRFKLAYVRDIAARLRLMSAATSKDITGRLRQKSADQVKDTAARLRLMSANQRKDIPGRLWLVLGTARRDVASRFRQMSAVQTRDIPGRFLLALASTRIKDVASRFRQKSADQLRDVASRFRQMSALQMRDVASRFRQKSANQGRDTAARLRLMSANQLKDIASRFRQRSSDQVRDVASRFRQMSAAGRCDIATRLRQMSANQLRDIAARFRQSSQPQVRDLRSRFLLAIVLSGARDIRCRFILVDASLFAHITVVAPRGTLTTQAARGTLSTVAPRGNILVEEI